MNPEVLSPSEPVPPPSSHGVRVPINRPVLTNVLLVLIVIIYLVESLLSASLFDTDIDALVTLGAQVNFLVALGQHWRLLAAMFLHIGLMHLLFNGWALFSLGREVEAFYGSLRFAVIFLLAGLFGSLAFYLGGAAQVPSAGASGAIFGLIGADIAFFFRNRRLFGRLSRQQLGNLVTLVVINLIFGFTVAGINNLAHLGGLVGGALIGLGLAPHYEVRWEGLALTPRLASRTPVLLQVAATVLALALLAGGVRLGDEQWAARIPRLRQHPQAILVYPPPPSVDRLK